MSRGSLRVLFALLAACGDNHGGGLAAPTDVEASDGASSAAVTVTWSAVAGATSYRVWRDGEPLATVDTLVYEDTTAAAPRIEPPVLEASAGSFSDRVELTWTLAGAPGAKHSYFVTALTDDDESARSFANAGFRGAPEVMQYELSRDGGLTFFTSTLETRFADTQAPAGNVTSGKVTASDGTSSAHIAVSLSAMGVSGAPVSYVVRAVTSAGTLTSNTATGHRGIGQVTCAWYRYEFSPTGSARTLLPNVTATSFVDTDTAAGQRHAYDCTFAVPGTTPFTTAPDVGWRAPTPSEMPRRDTWVTNAAVSAAAVTPEAIYIGGAFTYVGPPTGAFAAIDATTGEAMLTPTRVAESRNPNLEGVATAIQDAAGNWYLGGNFEAVSGVPQSHLARTSPTGEVDPTFAPLFVDGAIESIAVDGNRVFVAGSFTSVNLQPCDGFAVLDATTGATVPFALAMTGPTPGAQRLISRVFARSGVLFVSGPFVTINGLARRNLAAIDLASVSVTSWNAQANGAAAIRALSGATLYVGGDFTQIGGQPRAGFAAIDATSAAANAFDPAPLNPGVVVQAGTRVYVTAAVPGDALRVSVLDASTGATLATHDYPVEPGAIDGVRALAVRGDTIYVGGEFTIAGAQPRSHLMAIDATTGAILGWAPRTMFPVHALALVGDTVYAGGSFWSIGGKERRGLAALDPATGALLAWNPDVGFDGFAGTVGALAIAGNRVFVGGFFRSIGGQSRTSLACVDRTTGAATSWTANLDLGGVVYDLLLDGNRLYVAGWYATIAGQSRSSLAAIDIDTASVAAWNPNVEGRLLRLALDGNTVYLGGRFTSVGGTAHPGIARVDATTGQVSSWSPDSSARIFEDIAITGGKLYAAGDFEGLDGEPREALASFDLPSGAVSSWMPVTEHASSLVGLAVVGPVVYTGGSVWVAGRLPNALGAFEIATGDAAPWNPWTLGVPRRIVAAGSTLLVLGTTEVVAGYPRGGISIFDL